MLLKDYLLNYIDRDINVSYVVIGQNYVMIAFGFASLVGISIRLLYKGTHRSLKVKLFWRYLLFGLFYIVKQLLIDKWDTYNING